MCIFKNKFIISFSMVVPITILGCNLSNNSNDVVLQPLCEIDITKSVDKVTSTNLSCISDNIIYIPLQTLPDILLNSIINIQICKSGIYICDGEMVFKFSSIGNFIKIVGGIGNGPGEYVHPFLLAVNEEANTIFVNSENKGLLKYDLNGNYIDRYQNLGSITNLVYKRDKIYLNTNSFSKKESNIIVADNQLNVLQRFQKIQTIAGVFSFALKLYCYNDEVYCKGPFNDTIYHICKEGLIPHTIIKLGKNQLPTDLSINDIITQNPEIMDKYFIHSNIIETGDFLFAELSTLKAIEKVEQVKYLLYNKIERTETILPRIGFVNDINNGLPFVPRYLLNDSIYVDYVDANKLIEWVNSETFKTDMPKYPEKKEELEKLANSLKETDNPVLIMVRLKN